MPRLIPSVNLLMFPPPSGVIDALRDLVGSGELAEHAIVSVMRALSGFAIGGSGGIVIGLLTARVLPLRYLSDPVLHGLRSVPGIALVPLAIIWFGIGETSKIALITWGAFFPVWINSFLGARDVSTVLVRSAESLGCRGGRMLFRVVLPAALPLILAGLRQSLTVALIVMVAAELIGARNGLGQLISSSHQLFRVDYMFVGLLTLGAVGFSLDRVFAILLTWLFPWYGRN
jgi:NitT/TauT family transport system permease protein/sulfonate transport system permease protein